MDLDVLCSLEKKQEPKRTHLLHAPRSSEDREPDAEADAERRPVVRADVPEDEPEVVPVHERGGGGGCHAQAAAGVQPPLVMEMVHWRRRGRDRGHRGRGKKKEGKQNKG